MKDHDWSWTLFGAALVSLESLDMIFDVYNAKIASRTIVARGNNILQGVASFRF